MSESLKNIVYVDLTELDCSSGSNLCANKERTISYGLYVDVPSQPVTPDEVFKECCYNHIVLADLTSDDKYKNDFSGFYHNRQTTTESCVFVMIDLSDGTEYELSDNTYGVFYDFGTITSNENLSYFVLSWKKILQSLGQGSYKIIKRINIVGIDVEIEYLTYNLFQYSTGLADKTVRIDVSMDGLLEKINVDFTDSNFETSLRVHGFFGRREPTWEEDNIITRGYVKRQVSMKQTNEYKFQTLMIPDCLTNEIFDFMLFSDNIKMNDYNLNNHSYSFVDFPVKLASNEGTRYASTTRKAQLNLIFNDKTVNNNKRNY